MILANNYVYDSRVQAEAKALASNGYRIIIIDWDRDGNSPVPDKMESIEVHRVRTGLILRLIKRWSIQILFFWRHATKLLKKIDFDAIHCHDLNTLPAGHHAVRKYKVPLIYDAHEIYPYLLERGRSWLIRPLFQYLDKKGSCYVHQVIIADQYYQPYFQGLGYTDPVTVLNTKKLIGTSYKEPGMQKFTLCYLGSLLPSRFLVELCEIVAGIPDVELIIAGKGPLEKKMHHFSKTIPNIQFLGLIHTDQVIPWTQKCHVVVCMIDPNDRNNQIATANKQFEAMICGRPIISTQGTRSGQITLEENCGLVIPYKKESLRMAIQRLRDDQRLREQLGRKALASAKKKYNWALEQKKLLDMYKALF